MIFVTLILSLGLAGCLSGSSSHQQKKEACGRFEICHANHTHRNSRHHTDVHHQHVEKNDAKQASE